MIPCMVGWSFSSHYDVAFVRVASDEAPPLVRIWGAGGVALPSDDRGTISRATVGQVHVSYVLNIVSMPFSVVVSGLE